MLENKEMTREEKIETLKRKLTNLAMIDHWTMEDYKLDRLWTAELRKLEKKD